MRASQDAKKKQVPPKTVSPSWILAFLSFALIAGGFSGCGEATRIGVNKTSSFQGGWEDFHPAQRYEFELTGPQGMESIFSTDLIQTDTILRARITPGPARPIVLPDQNFPAAEYTCIQYRLTLYTKVNQQLVRNGPSITTAPLAVGGTPTSYCPGGQADDTIDFSGRLSGPYPSMIQIDSARYDFYCQMWDWVRYNTGFDPNNVVGPRFSVCPFKEVYKTHRISGILEVETNSF